MLDKNKLKKVLEMMNQRSSTKMPAMKPVLEIIDMVMDEKMLDWCLAVGPGPVAKTEMQRIYHEMYGGSQKEWEEHWKATLIRGFYQPESNDNRNDYTMVSMFPGWIEMSVAGLDEPVSSQILDKFVEYWDTLKDINVAPMRYLDTMKYMKRLEKGMPPRFRTMITQSREKHRDGVKEIQLNQPLTSQQAVLPAGSVYSVLERFKDELAIMHCFCRLHKTQHGGSCRLNLPVEEGCLLLGPTAWQMVSTGVAKAITFEEACDIMKMYDEGGAVHCVYHYGNSVDREEMLICNCCADCCLLFKGYHEGGMSKIFTRAYASPKMIDETRCVGCGRCDKVCPTGATFYDKKNKKLVFEYDKCIGCGQCVYQCKFDVREMVEDTRDVFVKTKKKSEAIKF